MFRFEICGLDDVEHRCGDASRVISLIDPGACVRPMAHAKHLILHLHDVDRALPALGLDVPPTMEHLVAVLDFARALTEEDRLLIHCHAGVSRSTAMMIAILIQHGMPFSEAFRQVAEARPVLWPNQRIVELTDTRFRLHGAYLELVSTWKQRLTMVLSEDGRRLDLGANEPDRSG